MLNPDYFPEPDAIEETESEPVQGYTKVEADRRCKAVAAQYNGKNPRTKHRAKAWWDCEFEVLRTPE